MQKVIILFSTSLKIPFSQKFTIRYASQSVSSHSKIPTEVTPLNVSRTTIMIQKPYYSHSQYLHILRTPIHVKMMGQLEVMNGMAIKWQESVKGCCFFSVSSTWLFGFETKPVRRQRKDRVCQIVSNRNVLLVSK